jgi:predicted ABC-type sugar transport system permease subunit
MGQNWELVSDAINNIVQFKVFYCDNQAFFLCNMLCHVTKHAVCSLFLLTIPTFNMFSGCVALSVCVCVFLLSMYV